MAVVRDITIDQLIQAVTGISTSGMSDSTGQAIKNSIDALTTALTTEKANRDASNVTDASAWMNAIGLNKIKIGGAFSAYAQNNGNARIETPIVIDLSNYTQVTASKSSNISCTIYGSISAIGCTASLTSELINGVLRLTVTPSVTLLNYTAAAKIFMLSFDEVITLTLR